MTKSQETCLGRAIVEEHARLAGDGRSETMPQFERYIGIDYSGAETPQASLKGLRVYAANRTNLPEEIPPPLGPKRYWTRSALAHWLIATLSEEGSLAIVGIDHGFSVPLRYFEAHGLSPDWPALLRDFSAHWPTDGDHMYVDFIRDGLYGDAAARGGSTRWRRLTEVRAGKAKSVFHFDVPGSVAKSTHAGLPWLRRLREQTRGRVHIWPFDGWRIGQGMSCVAEVYPSLWNKQFPREDRTSDQHDAFSIAAWLQRVDVDGTLERHFELPLNETDRAYAEVEGWILGVS
ncbi:MAG: hypothetical protein ACT4NU_02385 [Chromatiales bacterium]